MTKPEKKIISPRNKDQDSERRQKLQRIHTHAASLEKLDTSGEVMVQVERLPPGTQMADGSIYAGLAADGRKQIFAMPDDLLTAMFNNTAKVVDSLNREATLGHSDWTIPSLEELYVLYDNQNEGALKGSFSSGWYWASTRPPHPSDYQYVIRFAGGLKSTAPNDIDSYLCRPVRVVEPSLAPAPL